MDDLFVLKDLKVHQFLKHCTNNKLRTYTKLRLKIRKIELYSIVFANDFNLFKEFPL